MATFQSVLTDLTRLAVAVAGLVRGRPPSDAGNIDEITPPLEPAELAVLQSSQTAATPKALFQIDDKPRQRAEWTVTLTKT